MNKSLIRLKNVTKSYKVDFQKSILAIKDINLEIAEGEFFVFVGPSGCGKSTLLRIMSGLETEYEGKVIFSKNLDKSHLSFVFQQFALFPWLTVFENIELGLLSGNFSSQERKEKVFAQLKRLNLIGFEKSYPGELSGGMKQRVGIARALVIKPKVMFLDEPFSELDSFTAKQLREDLLHIWLEENLTIVLVTHIIQEAVQLADRVGVMSSRPGTVDKIFENKLARPRQSRSPEFYQLEDKMTGLIRL